MKSSEELLQWLLNHESDFEPKSFARGLHYFHNVLQHTQGDIEVTPVSHYPYGRNLRTEKPDLTFRINMALISDDGTCAPYEVTIEFDDPGQRR